MTHLFQAAVRPEFRKERCVVHNAYRSVSFSGGEMSVPDDWPGESSGDGLQYFIGSPDDTLMITLSVYYFTTDGSAEDAQHVFDRFLQIRRDSEFSAAPDADITIGVADVLQHEDGTLSATYEGQEADERRFAAKLAMKGGTLAVVYLEAVGEDLAAVEEIAPAIFQSLVVRAV
ncbi:hypothetical protein [Acidocella facilis]|uniref:hypothetical protein n=1 Tax=Acidocella facilis TaxID=525 RepID=UPI0012DCDBB3|nr:hypothetical protein [Acidocella facilis]